MLVDDMDIAAAGIGLPQLDQRVRHAAAVFIEHMAVHDDALAERLALALGVRSWSFSRTVSWP